MKKTEVTSLVLVWNCIVISNYTTKIFAEGPQVFKIFVKIA